MKYKYGIMLLSINILFYSSTIHASYYEPLNVEKEEKEGIRTFFYEENSTSNSCCCKCIEKSVLCSLTGGVCVCFLIPTFLYSCLYAGCMICCNQHTASVYSSCCETFYNCAYCLASYEEHREEKHEDCNDLCSFLPSESA